MISRLGLHICGRARAELNNVSSIPEIVAQIVTNRREDVQVKRYPPKDAQHGHHIELTQLSDERHAGNDRDIHTVTTIKAQNISIERAVSKAQFQKIPPF